MLVFLLSFPQDGEMDLKGMYVRRFRIICRSMKVPRGSGSKQICRLAWNLIKSQFSYFFPWRMEKWTKRKCTYVDVLTSFTDSLFLLFPRCPVLDWEALVLIDEGAQSLTSSSTTPCMLLNSDTNINMWRENPTQQVLCREFLAFTSSRPKTTDRSVHC